MRINSLTAILLTAVFCFILFSPNIHALDFDPKSPWNQHNPGSYTPDGDGDPFGENDVYNPPEDPIEDSSLDLFILSAKCHVYNLFRFPINNHIIYKQLKRHSSRVPFKGFKMGKAE